MPILFVLIIFVLIFFIAKGMTGQKLSANGFKFLIQQETGKPDGQPELKPFRDAAGWSIGYGHYLGTTTPPPGMQITRAQAEAYLHDDVRAAEIVVAALPVKLNQNQFDALVSFVYNTGLGVFTEAPTLMTFLINQNWQGVANHLRTHWIQDNLGQVVLVSRRAAEANLFLS